MENGIAEKEVCLMIQALNNVLKEDKDLVEVEKMNDEMKEGMLLAYQSVKEEMDTIKAELKRKGIEENKGFSTLKGFIEDNIRQLN